MGSSTRLTRSREVILKLEHKAATGPCGIGACGEPSTGFIHGVNNRPVGVCADHRIGAHERGYIVHRDPLAPEPPVKPSATSEYNAFMTPEMARYLLRRHPRRPDDAAVCERAYLIRKRRWPYNQPAPIVYDTAGRLVDGADTLAAVAVSGITIRVNILRGVTSYRAVRP